MHQIKASKYVTMQTYLAIGLGYATADFISSYCSKLYCNDEVKQVPKEFKMLTNLKVSEPNDLHFGRNFIYGVISTNFAQIMHFKTNQFLQVTQRSPLTKLVISPFTCVPYYIFASIYDHRPIGQAIEQLQTDILILAPIRCAIDFLRIKLFFFKITKDSMPKRSMVTLFAGSKVINTLLLIAMYEHRFSTNSA